MKTELARLEALTEAQKIVFSEGCAALLRQIERLKAEIIRLNCRIAEQQIVAAHNDPDKRRTVHAHGVFLHAHEALAIVNLDKVEASRRLVLPPSPVTEGTHSLHTTHKSVPGS